MAFVEKGSVALPFADQNSLNAVLPGAWQPLEPAETCFRRHVLQRMHVAGIRHPAAVRGWCLHEPSRVTRSTTSAPERTVDSIRC